MQQLRLLTACLAALLLVALPAVASAAGTVNKLRCLKFGKRGVYFLPATSGASLKAPLPVAVMLHGLSGVGTDMVAKFRDLADAHRFVIVAPDLTYNGPTFDWDTQLVQHVSDCVAEVLAKSSLRLKPSGVLVAGFSAGGQFAPPVSAALANVTAVAVLHTVADKLDYQPYRPPNFLLTYGKTEGNSDMKTWAKGWQAGKWQCLKLPITVKEYAGGHSVSKGEAQDVVDWWLKGDGTKPLPPPKPRLPRLPATTASARELQRRLAVHHVFLSFLAAVDRDGNIAAYQVDSGIGGPSTKPFKVPSPWPVVSITTAPLWGQYGHMQQFYALLQNTGLEVLDVTSRRDLLQLNGPLQLYSGKRGTCPTSGIAAIEAAKGHMQLQEPRNKTTGFFVISTDGVLKCYDDNPDARGCIRMPAKLRAGVAGVAAVSPGWFHGLILLKSGALQAWGCTGKALDFDSSCWVQGPCAWSTNFGQCAVPAALAGGSAKVVAVQAGTILSVALLSNGSVRAWGSWGEISMFVPHTAERIPSLPLLLEEPPASNPVVAIAAGSEGYALLANSSLVVFGPTYSSNYTVLLDNVISMKVNQWASVQNSFQDQLAVVKRDGSVWHQSRTPGEPWAGKQALPPSTMV